MAATSRNTRSLAMMATGVLLLLLSAMYSLFTSNEQAATAGGIRTKHDHGGGATSGLLYQVEHVRTVEPDLLLYQKEHGGEKDSDQERKWPLGEFWNRPTSCKNWGTVTTIFPPTPAAESLVSLDDWCIVIAGDQKGPLSYDMPDGIDATKVVFLSQERQEELATYLDFVNLTPWNHFARKNVAYLYAIANGAQFIWDFDDDNMLFPNETLSRFTAAGDDEIQALQVYNTGGASCNSFNPYDFFGTSVDEIWPRGYPLDHITKLDCKISRHYCKKSLPIESLGILQSLADVDPDVDAIYRLTRPLPVHIEQGSVEAHQLVLVPPHSMSPMNAQAALVHRSAMWTLFLPTTVHGRVSDIWRSYIAQCLLRKMGVSIAFMGPYVAQERNAHAYLADLDAEAQLYDRSGSLITYLLDWQHPDGDNVSFEAAWERLYVDLYEHDIVEWDDVVLAQTWITSLLSIGYELPSMQTLRDAMEESDCQDENDWVKSLLSSGRSSPLPSKSRFHDVVLLGQFVTNTNPSLVIHWVQRWKEVFNKVIVSGPFDQESLDHLQSHGIDAVRADDDDGFYSPMRNLGQTLQRYSKDASVRGVMMIRDHLFVNMTQLLDSGFPSDNEIVGQVTPSALKNPVVIVYGNSSYSYEKEMFRSGNIRGSHLPPWRWWDQCINGADKALHDTRSKKYARKDGGLAIFGSAPSDFAYVPTSLANDFAAAADWLTDNEVYIECGMPTLFAMMKQKHNVSIRFLDYCTDQGSRTDNTEAWVSDCATGGVTLDAYSPQNQQPVAPYGLFYPLDIADGIVKFDHFFDGIVLGKALIEYKQPDIVIIDSKFDNVVLLGQFNFNQEAHIVTHWVRRWSEVFTHIVVMGPFEDSVLEQLSLNGVTAIRAAEDRGFYSPMSNLAAMLRSYANNTKIKGVMYAHDDMFVNITTLVEHGFPSDEILCQSGYDWAADPTFYDKPTLTVYNNSTYFFENQLHETGNYTVLEGGWWCWWDICIPKIAAGTNDTRSQEYLRADGGMDVFVHALGDFAYIPMSIGESFAAAAQWLADNQVFLECGMPTAIGMMKHRHNVVLKSFNTCTSHAGDRSEVNSYMPDCMHGVHNNIVVDEPFALYHPMKISKGLAEWDTYFDAIVLGQQGATSRLILGSSNPK